MMFSSIVSKLACHQESDQLSASGNRVPMGGEAVGTAGKTWCPCFFSRRMNVTAALLKTSSHGKICNKSVCFSIRKNIIWNISRPQQNIIEFDEHNTHTCTDLSVPTVAH